MFVINTDGSIFLTRGDVACLEIAARTSSGEEYTFRNGDIVRLKVTNRKHCDQIVLQKDVLIDTDTTTVSMYLEKKDTRFGDIIHKPVDYWYEVEINPDTVPQTIVGYDSNGPKIFRLFPEGGDMT